MGVSPGRVRGFFRQFEPTHLAAAPLQPIGGDDVCMNAAVAYLRETGRTLDDYDGACVELAGDVIGDREDWSLAWLEEANGGELPGVDNLWKWHAVAVDPQGLVHDPWFPELVLPLDAYLAEAFGGVEVAVEMNPGKED